MYDGTIWCAYLDYDWENIIDLLGQNATITRNWLKRPMIVQPNGSNFGWTDLFTSSSSWLNASNLFIIVGLPKLLLDDSIKLDSGLLIVMILFT